MAKKFSLQKFKLLRNAGLHFKHDKFGIYTLTYMNKDVIEGIISAVGEKDGTVKFVNFWGYILDITRRAKESQIYSPTHIKVIFNLSNDLFAEILEQIQCIDFIEKNNTWLLDLIVYKFLEFLQGSSLWIAP